MNRRNFILGLGTAATLSGAASVTGAALSNTVESTANFQIIATDELTVQRNRYLEDGNSNSLDANGNFSDPVSNASIDNFDHNNSEGFEPNMSINETDNGELGMAFATDNSNDSAYNRNGSFTSDVNVRPYDGNGSVSSASEADEGRVAPLEVVNNGGSPKSVGVEYELGDDYNSGDMTAEDVVQLFTFEIGDQQISPDRSDVSSGPSITQDNDNVVEIAPGERRAVDFVVNYTDTLEEKVSSAASGTGTFGFDSTATSTADLLDSVVFGDDS